MVNRGRDHNFTLYWGEDNAPNLGEGISRTTKENSSLWRIEVSFGHGRPMRELIRAVNHNQARYFAKNRYPSATNITLIGKANDSNIQPST
jgi:hypothetical protein